MFHVKEHKAKKQAEELITELQRKYENNYKDVAMAARTDAENGIEAMHTSGELSEKDYGKFRKRLDEYAELMKDYHH